VCAATCRCRAAGYVYETCLDGAGGGFANGIQALWLIPVGSDCFLVGLCEPAGRKNQRRWRFFCANILLLFGTYPIFAAL
jgi:hypothetical protein